MEALLIGGTSHCGKSTLAKNVSEALGWRSVSTDALGRHPGRPWLNIPQPVREFYESLSDETIYWFHRVHHDNMWPLLTQTIAAERDRGGGFVLEGSALRPEKVAGLPDFDGLAICLHAPPDFLADRMRAESDYIHRAPAERRLIDKFIVRSLRDNLEFANAARNHDITLIDVSEPAAFERAVAELIDRSNPARTP